jgi:hypothetical protein
VNVNVVLVASQTCMPRSWLESGKWKGLDSVYLKKEYQEVRVG